MPDDAPDARCWYCGRAHRKADDPREHVIADALSGTLTVPCAARACNKRAGREIDFPLQSDWFIATRMHLLGLNGRKPVVEASVRGDPASVGIGPDMKPKPRSGIDIGDAEATIVAASADDVDRLTARLEKQLAAEGRSISGPSTSREVAVELVDIPIGINGVTWLRAAAKMALGVMSLSQPEDWLDTPAARQLIGWLWDETPIDDDGNPKFLFPRAPDEEQADLFPPPAHVILQKNLADGRAGLAFTLFGAHIVSLTVEVLEPVEDTCWIMEPDQRCREVSFAQYAAAWAEDRVRSSRTHASAALHDAPASDS
jgi:hypothetical protein